MRVSGILETCLYVDDLEIAEHFYRDVLGLEMLSRVEGRHVFFYCGSRMLLLFNAEKTRQSEDVPAHGTTGCSHVCFAIRADELPTWEAHLRKYGIEIEHRIMWGDRGESVYFRDPAGNSLELATPRIWNIPEEKALPG